MHGILLSNFNFCGRRRRCRGALDRAPNGAARHPLWLNNRQISGKSAAQQRFLHPEDGDPFRTRARLSSTTGPRNEKRRPRVHPGIGAHCASLHFPTTALPAIRQARFQIPRTKPSSAATGINAETPARFEASPDPPQSHAAGRGPGRRRRLSRTPLCYTAIRPRRLPEGWPSG
jgi:hypothetical protein